MHLLQTTGTDDNDVYYGERVQVISSTDILATLRADTEVEQLRDALRRAHQQLAKKEAKTLELTAAVYQAAHDAALSTLVVPTKPPKRKTLVAVKDEEVALLHLTDWQYGKRTSDYSRAVCEARVMACVEKSIAIATYHSTQRPVRSIHLMLGGDMVEGMTIFPSQVFEIEAGLFEQLFGVSELIVRAVTRLASHFEEVVVWEESGNHGRIGKKDELPGDENIDRMAYKIARDRILPVLGNVTWHEQTDWHQMVHIGKYTALLVHGDEIRSFGGNHPSYGITKKVTSWSAGVLEPFHDCYMGHFHRPDTYTLPNGGSIYITGSTESRSEYARMFVGALGKPSQRLHFIDPRKGQVTAEYRLWCA